MEATTTIDPVCGMHVEPVHAAGNSEFDGNTYHFCSASCKRKFDADPSAFARAKGKVATRTSAGTAAKAKATKQPAVRLRKWV